MQKLFSFLALFFISCLFSQTSYYYRNGKKQELQIDRQKINLFVSSNFQPQQLVDLPPHSYQAKNSNNPWGTITFSNEISTIAFYQAISQLKSKANITGVGYYYKANNGKSVGTSNLFYVKLKQPQDYAILQAEATNKKANITRAVASDGEWYCLKAGTTATGNSVELSNYFYETGKFANVDPGFVLNFIFDTTNGELLTDATTTTNCVNDTGFGSQWGLHNPINTAVDINACAAWQLATGQGVKVAVIDNGIKLNHLDIATNIYPQSYDADSQTQPSQLTPDVFNPGYYLNHGMHVAGIIGAKANNNLNIAGVAHNSTIIGISSALMTANEIYNTTELLAGGIDWAKAQDADIINCSWFADEGCEDCGFSSALLEDRIIYALDYGRNGKGAIVVFAAGNEYGSINYPAYIDPRIMVVGASTNTGQRAAFSSYFTSAPGFENNAVDVVAPGENINSLLVNVIPNVPNPPLVVDPIGGTSSFQSGTSMAAPHVSGVAALVLEANPCLSGQQVRDIIEQTAQKVGGYSYTLTAGKPNGTWNNEMGYGLLDAHAAVVMAQQMQSGTLDLYIKDSQGDTGAEPNTVTQYMWTSDNIWVRNNNDSGLTHENPDYSATGNPNYVKVRVINKSCVASTGNDQLILYWAKASTALGYPNPWFGGVNVPYANMGNPIDTLTIPVIPAGGETILTFPWQVPNPANYGSDGNQWHFCLLARIEASTDPMTFPETGDLNANVRNNNNIAWKNVTVVDVLPNNIVNPGGVVAVGNTFNHPKTFFLELEVADLETGKPIYQEAEVGIKMNDVLFNAWERGGKAAQLLDPTTEEKRKIVKGNNVIVDNILFNANEIGTLRLDFNFLTKELTDKTNYAYHVIQKDAETGQVIGGETFIINKNPRTIFEAEAPDKEVDLNQAIIISAEDINEPAVYNWYDSEGNLIFEGKDLQIANAVAEKYKLEVIATTDGFKDYKEVEVTLKPSTLDTISPNSVTTNATISYKINKGNSAYLMVIGFYGSNGISNNYMLDVNAVETNINVSNYPSGYYTIALVVDGEILDAKTMIKE